MLAEDPGSTRPERHFASGAAQTRTVSVGRIRLDSWKSMRSYKGIICGDISEIAVGRASLSAPRTEPSGPHSGTRLPPRVFDGEALLGPRMKDAGPGEKVIRQLRDPSPGRAILLTAPPERAAPEVDDPKTERAK